MKHNLNRSLLLCVLFATAMAYLEAAVVVYLRTIYYPAGFTFPLAEIKKSLLLTEIGRETATMVMLYIISRLPARNKREQFAYFVLNFGIWDIWYYLWLKILLNWPSSLLEWDILFLIPLPWVSPILAPVLISLLLIIAAYIILQYENKQQPIHLGGVGWLLEILAGLLVLISFITNTAVINNKGIPTYYPWWLFILGILLGSGVFVFRWFSGKKLLKNSN